MNEEKVSSEKETKSNLPAHWLQNGGPGRKKGVPNRFHLQKQEFFKACKDGKLFVWVQQVLDGKDDRKKLEILKVWASLQPKEVRAEFEGCGVTLNLFPPGEKPEKADRVIDVDSGGANQSGKQSQT